MCDIKSKGLIVQKHIFFKVHIFENHLKKKTKTVAV